MMHPTQRNKLAIDPDSAAVVRRIFDEALEGSNTSQIAEGLNDDKVPTPGQYFKSKYPGNKKFSRMSDKISWTTSMVYKVIISYVYTGATVGHKRKSAGVGNKKTIAQEHDDWIIVEGMHEAIVSKDEFELAQAVIRGVEKKPDRKVRQYPLRGLVYCPNCKRVMTRRKLRNSGYFYTCTHSTHDKDTECAVGERYSETELERIVFNAIGQFVSLAEKQSVQNRKVGKVRKTAIDECASRIRSLQTQAEQLKGVKLRWYEKYTAGDISREEYLKAKSETDAKISETDEAIRKAHDRMQQLDSERPCSDDKLDAICDLYARSEKQTNELAHAFIKAIYVHSDNRIELEWKFKDFLTSE